MKNNKMREMIRNGAPMTTTRVWSTWPFFTEAIGATGNFDYIEFVGEYSPYTQLDLENLARAAELHDMGCMMKVDFQNRGFVAQKAIAVSLGIPKENVVILHSGDVLELDENGAEVTGRVQTGEIMVDGLGVGDVGNVVLRDRQHLAEDGVVVVAFAIDSYNGEMVSGPEITSRGFVYLKESQELIDTATAVARDAVEAAMARGISDWNKYRTIVREELSDYFWKKTQRRPMIMPMILEI